MRTHRDATELEIGNRSKRDLDAENLNLHHEKMSVLVNRQSVLKLGFWGIDPLTRTTVRDLTYGPTDRGSSYDPWMVPVSAISSTRNLQSGLFSYTSVDVDGGICVGAGVDGQSVWATSCSRYSGFLCEKCRKHDDDSIMGIRPYPGGMDWIGAKKGRMNVYKS
ncbi:hypothetical protein MTR67_034832 [Solanum verrucosum]|uniref:Uncharacterized protein n=1 Tax=Solanum verrucosum TaxID=315347 RepID=A0AAF0ZJL7_SOLVR|nr:hypothetical protein MTR67_034832 [Solanum verrucosum]